MIFQDVGSNYTFGSALRQLFTIGSRRDNDEFTTALEKYYEGKVALFSKGRGALAEAVRIACIDAPSESFVAVNGMTCYVLVEAVEDGGARALYVDVAPDTAHFDAAGLASALESQPGVRAVIVQNTYGRMCDIAAIERIAREHGALLIEDLAHCVGQYYPDGREAGTVGDMAMLSFGRDKLLDVANGGALIVRSDRLKPALATPTATPRLLDQFRDRIYPLLTVLVRSLYNVLLGKIIHILMYKLGLAVRSSDGGIQRTHTMPGWQARLAHRQFRRLGEHNKHRREIMQLYEDFFDDKLLSRGGTIRAALTVAQPDRTIMRLRQAGFALNDIWYNTPVGPTRKYTQVHYPEESCPQSVQLAKQIINLPTHRGVHADTAKRIATIVRNDD